MHIPQLEAYREERIQVGDTLHVWRHKLRVIERTETEVRLRVSAEHSFWADQLPADVVIEKRLEMA